MIALIAALSALSPSTQAADKPTSLTSDLAQAYVTKALECGRKNGWKLSVAVVNAEGNLVAFRRDDGAYAGSIGAATDKAAASAKFARPTRAFTEALMKDGRIGLLSVNGIVGIEGGLPITLNGVLVGAIGASGARSLEDEQCAKAAIE